MSTSLARSRWVSHRRYTDGHDATTIRRRPEGGIDGRALRIGNHQDDEPASYTCECERPEWVGCGPIFSAVRQCARCGRPDRDELGTWPDRLNLRRRLVMAAHDDNTATLETEQ